MADVIYMRCSTRPQAHGHSLIRQLEECTRFASKHGVSVGGVFCDIASGAGRLPQRDLAIAFAKRSRGRVLVESSDRWSRAGNDGSEATEFFMSGRVVECADHAIEFRHKIAAIVSGVPFDE